MGKLVGMESIIANIEKYGENIKSKADYAMEYQMAQGEREMKTSAPWTDRTGQARRSLSGTKVSSQKSVKGYMVTGVEYGKWLETRWKGHFRIIVPVWQSVCRRILRSIK